MAKLDRVTPRRSAQGRNRTTDTGILSPRRSVARREGKQGLERVREVVPGQDRDSRGARSFRRRRARPPLTGLDPGVEIFECVHAIGGIGADERAGGSPALKNVIGTAFHLGGQRFMSAAHVLRELETYPIRRVGYADAGRMHFVTVDEIEYADHVDVGVFHADVPGRPTPRWSFSEEPLLQDIVAGGFPYALDLERVSITPRAFKGYIVAGYKYFQMAGHPNVYETSFQSPRGLSGAPLWKGGFGAPLHVVGLIVANRSTEMLVFSERERTRQGTETVVERFEAMQHGLAIQSVEIADLTFRGLGGPVRSYVERQTPSP